MNWAEGFSASYKAYQVDPNTWEDLEEVPIISGSINRDSGDALLESASLDVREKLGEIWIRVYLLADQGGVVRVPLFTGLTATPTRALDGQRESYSVDCYSRLKVAADKMLPLGYYVAAGTRAAETAVQLLKTAGITATCAVGSGNLTNYIIAEGSETVLTMVHRIVQAIGWQVAIDGRGQVRIVPPDTSIKATFGGDIDVIELAVNDTDDWYSCPNVLRVTCGSQTAVVYDDDSASDLSIQARGREIWAQESVSMSDTSALPVYARQRLKELQAHTRTLTYTRRFHPEVGLGSVVSIAYPQSGLAGNFRVRSQKITLGHGAKTEEEVYEY